MSKSCKKTDTKTTDVNFYSYYSKYLGIDDTNHSGIFASNQRNMPLAINYFQYLIVTPSKSGLIFSIAPQFSTELKELLSLLKPEKIDSKLINEIDEFFNGKKITHYTRKMYRMTVDDIPVILNNQERLARQLTIDDKHIFFNSGKKTNDRAFKEYKWGQLEELIRSERVFGVIYGNKIVSLAQVSNVDYNGGNIAVMTAPEFRSLGYGKLAVTEAINWCFNNKIVPIYWVDSLNLNSLKLAHSLGFKIMSEELVFSIIKN